MQHVTGLRNGWLEIAGFVQDIDFFAAVWADHPLFTLPQSCVNRYIVRPFQRDDLIDVWSRYCFWLIFVRPWLKVLPIIFLKPCIATSKWHLSHVPWSGLLVVCEREWPADFILAGSNSRSYIFVYKRCFVIVIKPTTCISRISLHFLLIIISQNKTSERENDNS